MNDGGERWAATLALINALWPPLTEGHRVSEGRIAAAEARLGVTLPLALREWYLMAGERGDFLGNQDNLNPPEDIAGGVFAAGVIVFASENQFCCEWGIRRADMGQDDPPVVEVNPGRAEDEECASPYAESVSGFFARMVHDGSFLSAPFNNGVVRYGGRVSSNVPEAVEAAIRRHYPALAGPTGMEGAELFSDGDTLLRLSEEDGARVVAVAVRTLAAAERLVALTGFPADELQHQGRYWHHGFGPDCKDVGPGYILRHPFPAGVEVDEDALMQAPYCQADAAGPKMSTHKLNVAEEEGGDNV